MVNGYVQKYYEICMYTIKITYVYIQNIQLYIDITLGLYYYKSTRQLELGCFVAKTVKFQNYL